MKGEDNRTYTRREVVGGMGLGITALSTGAVAAGLGGDAAAASVAPARRHRPDLRFRHRLGLSTLFLIALEMALTGPSGRRARPWRERTEPGAAARPARPRRAAPRAGRAWR